MSEHSPQSADPAAGSALVMAIFVLVLLTTLGLALLTLSQLEMNMVQADSRAKAVFYVAEAGVEDGRDRLQIVNLASTLPGSLDDELDFHAGPNDRFDFDPASLRPLYDGNGNVTGFTGYDDDVPLRGPTPFADGIYAAFLTNDVVDEVTDPLDDTNNRVVISAIGTGPGFAVEVVQALVVRQTIPDLPAAITILGPAPTFTGGTSAAKLLTGDDCEGSGIPDLYVPVVGVIGASSETLAEAGVSQPATYVSDDDTGVDTVTDVEGDINPLWKDCDYLRDLAEQVRDVADVVGDATTPFSEFGTPGDPKIVYIEGDYSIPGGSVGAGLLWVTGRLQSLGDVSWDGILFVVGKGLFRRDGGGVADYRGGFLVADIAGVDETMWTADDCAGPDGVPLTADDGLQPAAWIVNGSGAGTTTYCTALINDALQFPFRVVQFRQR